MHDVQATLAHLTPAQQTALKRHVGKRLSEANAEALQAFYLVVPREIAQTWREERLFAVLCMACLWTEEAHRDPKPLAICLRQVAQTESANHRFRAVLDTRWEEDGYLLAKFARLVRWVRSTSEWLYPDFDALFADLLYWNGDERRVQRKWAQQYFGEAESNEAGTNDAEIGEEEE